MKKILFILFGVFAVAGAFAAGENIPTSKSYVDSKLGEKQDTIPANDGAARVLTNTGTAGEYGTRGIYDANGAYATQTQNLVDAATMNAGVQNAIDSEFQCIEWADPNDHTSDCLLMDVFGQTERRSPNLFNKDDSRIIRKKWFNFETSKIGTNFYSQYKIDSSELFISEPIAVQPNTTYTASNYKSNSYAMANPSFVFLDENFVIIDGFKNGGRDQRTFTVPNDNRIKYVILPGHIEQMDVMQFEIGTTATPYVPYGNLYLPNGE